MKKQILSFAFAAAIIVAVAGSGCMSEKAASGSGDSTMTDSTATMSTPTTTDSTTTTDTTSRDTSRTNPPQH